MTSKPFNISDALTDEVFYQTEGTFYEPLFVFESKVSSLFRFYQLNQAVSRKFLAESHTSLAIETAKKTNAELIDLHVEITGSDSEYFEKFVFSSTLTQLFSAYEAFLLGLIELLRDKTGSDVPISKENVPLVNRYLKWMREHGSCNVSIPKETNIIFDIVRHVRNSFVHGEVVSFPEQMKGKVQSLKDSATSQGLSDSQYFLLLGFKAVGDSAKQVELAFLRVMDQEVVFIDELPDPLPRLFCIAIISEPSTTYDRLTVGEHLYGLPHEDDDSLFFLSSTPCRSRKLQYFSNDHLRLGVKNPLYLFTSAYGDVIYTKDLSKLDMLFVASPTKIQQVFVEDLPMYVSENSVIEFVEYYTQGER